MSKLSRFFSKWGPGGLRRSLERKRARRQQRQLAQTLTGSQQATTVDRLFLARYPDCQKLPIYRAPGPAGRVSIVTDSINAGSLYGGVGTALMLGAMIAEDRGTALRIVTRTEPAVPGNLQHVLAIAGLDLRQEAQFLFAPPSSTPASRVDVHEDELFITTSWWTTAATLGAVPDPQIVYLLQEDERMFYPFGDDRLYCERTLSNPDIRFAINSRLLKDHLERSGFTNIGRNGRHFEPAFPGNIFHQRPRVQGKRRFMFYARPHHARNLFYFGLEVVREAVEEGLLDPQEWEIVLVGKDIPKVTFDGAVQAETREGMSWHEYAEFIGSVDVALSLMYTPHPSYPPLDLAASGAWVVTNQYGNKLSLDHYSDRIVTRALDVSSLVDGLREAIGRSREPPTPARRVSEGLGRDWRVQLQPIVDHMRSA